MVVYRPLPELEDAHRDAPPTHLKSLRGRPPPPVPLGVWRSRHLILHETGSRSQARSRRLGLGVRRAAGRRTKPRRRSERSWPLVPEVLLEELRPSGLPSDVQLPVERQRIEDRREVNRQPSRRLHPRPDGPPAKMTGLPAPLPPIARWTAAYACFGASRNQVIPGQSRRLC